MLPSLHVFSPAQGFSTATYHQQAIASSGEVIAPSASSPLAASASPRTPQHSTMLVEPPVVSYYPKGAPLSIFPPLLGQKSVSWMQVFALVQQPKMLWSTWGPGKSLEHFADIEEVWIAYIDGAPELNASGADTGRRKPPLKLVDQYFQAYWRAPDDIKERSNIAKVWQRFREIPEWIDTHSRERDVSPNVIIDELQAMRVNTAQGNEPKGLNWLQLELMRLRKASKMIQPARRGNNRILIIFCSSI
ncbi:hypothetical protein B0H17DRAFT_1207941 [Mycena rosella]|uniref:Uncharacterized protein n=1 Tax=Mycena rosella TaxID=1033263 RepID=A0AAD7D5J1_MYCRO|nr:hypothetical protein B0H17DRAFT_1207941 [Mycena rosella]